MSWLVGENFIAIDLVAGRLPQLPVVCMSHASLTVNTNLRAVMKRFAFISKAAPQRYYNMFQIAQTLTIVCFQFASHSFRFYYHSAGGW